MTQEETEKTPALDSLQEKAAKVVLREEFYGSYDGIPIVELLISLQFVAGAVAGGLLGAIGKDIWTLLKSKIKKNRKPAAAVHENHEQALGDTSHGRQIVARLFVLAGDSQTKVLMRVVGAAAELESLEKATLATCAELHSLWAHRVNGAFEESRRPDQTDRQVGTICLSFDPEMKAPVAEFVESVTEFPMDGMILNSMFPTISREKGASTFRYLGWRIMRISKGPNRFAEARAEFKKALYLYGFDEPETCHGIAETHFNQKDFRNALQWYRRVVGRECRNPSVLINRGICEMLVGDGGQPSLTTSLRQFLARN